MWLRTVKLWALLMVKWKWGPVYAWQYANGWRERCQGEWLRHEVEHDNSY